MYKSFQRQRQIDLREGKNLALKERNPSCELLPMQQEDKEKKPARRHQQDE